MHWPLNTRREWALAGALVAFWAVAFVPNLRTNPPWYGDEGAVLEMSWTVSHGQARQGAFRNDFVFPISYPPLYLLINGSLLRLFGNDIIVGRALGAATGMAACVLLFWIGCRLRGKMFGFLCAASFLVCPELVANFRWVRPHPFAGMLSLASVGFLLRYVQEKRLRDIVWAGLLCSLATAANYFTYPLIGAVTLTAAIVNWPKRKQRWRPVLIAALAAGGYGALFVGWYIATQGGGWLQLREQLHRVAVLSDSMASAAPTLWGETVRVYRNVISFCLLTPISDARGNQGVDPWLILASVGFVVFPVKQFRKWLLLWLLALMYAVFKSNSASSRFTYSAMVFWPLMAVGFAGAMEAAGACAARWTRPVARAVPATLCLVLFGAVTVHSVFTQFRSKYEIYMVHSAADAEAAMAFVNARTTPDDFVVMPDQLFWLAKTERKAQLVHCASYLGYESEYFGTVIPREMFWFDCRLENAKFLVVAAGQNAKGEPTGIDNVYWLPKPSIRRTTELIGRERWPIVFQRGDYVVCANPRFSLPGGNAK